MPIGYGYGGYPVGGGGYYAPPVPDNLAALRAGQYGQPAPGTIPGTVQPVQPTQPVQPIQTQQPVQMPPVPQSQPAMMSGPVFVNGEAGAKGYLVAANNTVMLIDADPDANTFWLKSADPSGMPSMRTFDYTERIATPKPQNQPATAETVPAVEYVTRQEFEELAAKIEAIGAKKQNTGKKAAKEEEEDE